MVRPKVENRRYKKQNQNQQSVRLRVNKSCLALHKQSTLSAAVQRQQSKGKVKVSPTCWYEPWMIGMVHNIAASGPKIDRKSNPHIE